MRRRFGRRRKATNEGGRRVLDVQRELTRVTQAGLVSATSLEPAGSEDVPASLAAVGCGEEADGERLVVGVSPESGADAWLAALTVAARLAEEESFAGRVLAISPAWPLAARRRLDLLGEVPFRVEARLEPGGLPTEQVVAPEPPAPPRADSVEQAARSIVDANRRELFHRAAAALEGLAAKHGGVLRVSADALELVLLGRRVATLRGAGGHLELEATQPRREPIPLQSDALADGLDRLEGSLRKFLSDRRIREGEMGQRTALVPVLQAAAKLRDAVPWPSAGADTDPLDFVAVDVAGRPAVGIVRRDLDLAELGAILDAWIALGPWVPGLLAGAARPVRLELPRLVIGAERIESGALRVMKCLAGPYGFYELQSSGRRGPEFQPRELSPLTAGAAQVSARDERPTSEPEPAPVSKAEGRTEPEPSEAIETEEGEVEPKRARYEEMSIFDLGEEGAVADEPGGPGRRRRRRRRPRGRPRSSEGGSPGDEDSEAADDEGERAEAAERPGQPRPTGRGRGRGGRDRRRRRRPLMVEAADEESEEADDGLEEIAEEVPEFEEVASEEPETSYDEEEVEEEGADSEAELMRREREARRRARIAKSEPEIEPTPAPRAPRRRAAIVAHADRASIGAAVLLGRDLRLIEGIWIYPQSDLMTFFRGVATDLREETPIYLVGFTASPARETLQAASLYRDRLVWFDHHAWPPEDLGGLRAAIGEEAVHVDSSSGSLLPAVLRAATRRSRFTDKLVDLLTGRFSRHDYERWGRLWWSRLGELAERPGERRAELEPLLVGRPSDLAREAARAAEPPLPAELELVAGRDHRLVHFGGYALVLVSVPPEFDVQLSARLARERYGAQLSVAWSEGDDRLVLGSDDVTGRRALDLSSMAEHLASKFEWVDALPDDDHVARVRVRDFATRPERGDEVVGEIAMGRAILEG